jgi:integrase/recombinase XerD
MKYLLDEFEYDWKLEGKAESTVKLYKEQLVELFEAHSIVNALTAKQWMSEKPTQSMRRKRSQAIRAFGAWAEKNEIEGFLWWRQVPVEKEENKPQATVTHSDFKHALGKASSPRDKALVEVLWSCGLRRSEIARLDISDVNFSEGFLVIRTSKTGKPRIAPLSPSARQALRRHIGKRSQGSLFGMTTNAIRLCLARLGAPSAHAWRRGWAVHALRCGVSETSVRAAAGWSSGAMVARYTRALSGELAIDEFARIWSSN